MYRAVFAVLLWGCPDDAVKGGARRVAPDPGTVMSEATRFRPALVYIPPTEKTGFLMGSPGTEEGRSDNEGVHWVVLTRALWMTETPVTQHQWQALMGNEPSRFRGCPDCPVERVSWFEALRFANKLSLVDHRTPCYTMTECMGSPGEGCPEGQLHCESDYTCQEVVLVAGCTGFRLPTEAEWEWAARAGTDGPRYATLDIVAWHSGNSRRKTRPVKGKLENAFGLYDMLGGVQQWCWDGFEAHLPEEVTIDPAPSAGLHRVLRGGSWNIDAPRVRAAHRGRRPPTQRMADVGFRLVRRAP